MSLLGAQSERHLLRPARLGRLLGCNKIRHPSCLSSTLASPSIYPSISIILHLFRLLRRLLLPFLSLANKQHLRLVLSLWLSYIPFFPEQLAFSRLLRYTNSIFTRPQRSNTFTLYIHRRTSCSTRPFLPLRWLFLPPALFLLRLILLATPSRRVRIVVDLDALQWFN